MNSIRSADTSSRRSRRRLVIGALVIASAVLVAACGPSAAPPPAGPSAPPDAVTATIFARTNADRAAAGLAPLAWDARLAGLAAEWAQHLSDVQQLRHRDLAATIRSPGYEGYAALGENILVSPQAVDGNAMQDAWLSSPSHKANIMGNYDSIGVGLAHGSDGSVRAVANFGRSR